MAQSLTQEELDIINNANKADILATLSAEQGKINSKARQIVEAANKRLNVLNEQEKASKPNPVVKFATDLATAANQGITFGFGDELTGLLGAVGTMGSDAPFSERYSQYRDASRQDLANMNPVVRGGAEFAGGMLTGGTGATVGRQLLGRVPAVKTGDTGVDAAVRAKLIEADRRVAPPLLSPTTIPEAATAGAGAGIVAGLGGSEAPILSERTGQDMAVGGLLGGPLGALTLSPSIREAATTQLQSMINRTPQEKARSVIRRRVKDDVAPVETMANRLGAMRGGTMMDVSPSVRALGEDIVTEGGRPGQRLTEFVETRLSDSLRRVNETLSEIVGNPKAYYQNQRKFEQQMKEDSAPLYEEFRRQPITMNENLEDVIERVKLVRGNLIKEARSNAIAAKDAPIVKPRPNRDADADDVEDIPLDLDANMLDYIKQEMDDQIAGLIARDKGNKARALQILRNDLVDEVDKQTNNIYAKAREAYATPASNKAALEAGKKFMRLDGEEIEFILEDFATDMERDMFRLGAARAISQKIGARTTTQSVAKDLRAPLFKERLKELFPNQPGAYERLVKDFDDEDEMFQTFSRLITNSRTTPRAAGRERLSQQIAEAAGESAITGNFTEAVRKSSQFIGRVLGMTAQQRFARLSDEVKNEMATIILEGSPQQRAQVLRTLQNPNLLTIQPSATTGLLTNPGSLPIAAGIQGGLLSDKSE